MLKYLSLFSGIGAFESALTNLGVNYEVVNYCEIDKYASKSYSVIHGVPETKNLWDITKVNVFNLPKPGEIDLVTYGFPCQDISLAGKQKDYFDITHYGTILNDIEINDAKHGHFIRTLTYLYNDCLYFITKINGEVVEFVKS